MADASAPLRRPPPQAGPPAEQPSPAQPRSDLSARRLAVECRGLVKTYGDVVAVDGLDLEVATGECFGLLGPNGAGKTTTVEILEGLLEPDAGEVRVLGMRWAEDERALRERLGVQLQETRLSEKLTVEETVRLFRSFYRSGTSADEAIAAVELGEKRTARVGRLSGGQRQRLALACSLVGEPELLFLDEPTTGLDPHSRRGVWELVERFRAGGRTVVLTTHYMEEAARLCDHVAIVDRGKVIALGSPAQLVASLDADHVVEFRLTDGRRGPDEERLAALPGVTAVRRAGGKVYLSVREVHATLPVLLRVLAEHDLELTALSTHHATLEDVFIALTGRRLDDD